MPAAPVPENDAERLETLRRYSILGPLLERGYEHIKALAVYLRDAQRARQPGR